MTASPREPSVVKAVLGPTNTGKTHLAIERMLAQSSGMIGLPLRLLAREVYDRVVKSKGPQAAALITGEEKIAPKSARYFICTAEAMPVSRAVEFAAIDEVQLAGDPDRGHVFTHRMMHVRGAAETMLLGAETMRPLIRRLAPEAEHDRRERLSQLTHTGPAKLTKLPRRSAIVAFSAEAVYAIAEVLRRQRGGAAVVMGGLSPRTRNAQVDLYQSGEVDFLVATDAIGMGLNMDVDHVAFAALSKWDGRKRRALRPDEIAQIAGRAGRHTNDGTFGVTSDCRPLPEDVIARVTAHEFQAVQTLVWRNHRLDFSSIEALLRTLTTRAPDEKLRRIRDAVDEAALRALSEDADIAPLITGPDAVRRLWAACQIPDFRKTTVDQHVRLTAGFARHLLKGHGHIPQSWAGAEIAKLDKTSGEVDALSSRLAHIRTWTYAANRADWFADAEHWRGVAREVEDRLSDALHTRLTEKFVDRRTSALMRGLNAGHELEAHIDQSGDVVVEGYHVGRLNGLTFHPDSRGAALEARAVRNAAHRALRPEINRRLGAIARASDDAFALLDDMTVRHDGVSVGRLDQGRDRLNPAVTLIGARETPAPARERAIKRLETWVRSEITQRLAPLIALADAIERSAIRGLARGLAFRLVEHLGHIDRHAVAETVRDLSIAERRDLRRLGVRFGAHAVFMPALIKPKPARLCALIFAAYHGDAGRADLVLPSPGRTTMPVRRPRAEAAYAAAGYALCGPLAVRADALDRLDDLIRKTRAQAAAKPANTGDNTAGPADAAAQPAATAPPAKPAKVGPDTPFALTADMANLLGCSMADLAGVLKALGYRRVRPPRGHPPSHPSPAPEDALWRAPRPPKSTRPKTKPQRAPAKADTPFAALADLASPRRTPSDAPNRRRRRPKRSETPHG